MSIPIEKYDATEKGKTCNRLQRTQSDGGKFEIGHFRKNQGEIGNSTKIVFGNFGIASEIIFGNSETRKKV